MSKVTKLLERAIDMIEADLGHIEGRVKKGKLSHLDTEDLNRHYRSLLSMFELEEKLAKAPRKKLAEMSPTELAKAAEQEIQRLKSANTVVERDSKVDQAEDE